MQQRVILNSLHADFQGALSLDESRMFLYGGFIHYYYENEIFDKKKLTF